jgi:nicotinamide riboside transporter PnuC
MILARIQFRNNLSMILSLYKYTVLDDCGLYIWYREKSRLGEERKS